jgi:hypothetical protein
MKPMCKSFSMLLIVSLAISSMITIESVFAQSQQSVPEFTLKYVDKSYDVAPTTTSSTDPYTGKVTTTTTPGYHVPYETIEVKITNNIGASYYGLRYKGHYSDSWTYYPYNGPDDHYISDGFFPPDFQASNSSYTVGYLILDRLPQPIPEGAPIDVEVQALFGNFDVTPYGHAIYVGGPTYDAIFKGTTGDWSNTQTISLPSNSVSPSPTVPEFSSLAILPLFVIIPLIVSLLLRKSISLKAYN